MDSLYQVHAAAETRASSRGTSGGERPPSRSRAGTVAVGRLPFVSLPSDPLEWGPPGSFGAELRRDFLGPSPRRRPTARSRGIDKGGRGQRRPADGRKRRHRPGAAPLRPVARRGSRRRPDGSGTRRGSRARRTSSGCVRWVPGRHDSRGRSEDMLRSPRSAPSVSFVPTGRPEWRRAGRGRPGRRGGQRSLGPLADRVRPGT